MGSGLARWFGCALIVLATSCDPLLHGERAQSALGDGAVAVDDAVIAPPVDMHVEGGPADAPVEGGTDASSPDAMADAAMADAMVMPDAMAMADAMVMPDAMAMADAMAMPDAAPDAMSDASVPHGDGGLVDGGPDDGSLSDALNPDAREPPGLPVGGSSGDRIDSFYACSTGEGAAALPLLLAILALRRRTFRGSGVT